MCGLIGSDSKWFKELGAGWSSSSESDLGKSTSEAELSRGRIRNMNNLSCARICVSAL